MGWGPLAQLGSDSGHLRQGPLTPAPCLSSSFKRVASGWTALTLPSPWDAYGHPVTPTWADGMTVTPEGEMTHGRGQLEVGDT